MMNKVKGNMYEFVSHTWNVIRGRCPHDCKYCYVKRWPQKKLRFDEKELKTDLGKGNYIFVGSSCDMWADEIPEEWILKVLDKCKKHPNNKYLFQTKNPKRYWRFFEQFPNRSTLGVTIETNREYKISKAPLIRDRVDDMKRLHRDFEVMITIEPICDFDTDQLMYYMRCINPRWVNIGADSGNNKLEEPSKEKVLELIKELSKITEVRSKRNLGRLLR